MFFQIGLVFVWRVVFYPGTALSTRVDVCERSGRRAAAAEDGEMPCWGN